LDTDIGENEKVLLPTRMKKPVRVVASDAGGHFELDGLSEGFIDCSWSYPSQIMNAVCDGGECSEVD